MGFFSDTSEAISTAAAYVGEKTVEGATYAVRKAADGAEYVGGQVAKGVDFVVSEVNELGGAVKDGAALVYDAAARSFKAVKIGAAVALCDAKRAAVFISLAAWNEAVNQVAAVGAYVLSDPSVEIVLRELAKRTASAPSSDVASDGAVMDADACGCGCSGGVRPPNCRQPPGTLPTAHYINGINTGPKDHCATLRALADALCKEMTGTYNATFGMGKDIVECVDNIRRIETKPEEELFHEIIANIGANPPKEMDLYAHSQGGLITQHAVIQAKIAIMANYITQNCSNPPTEAELTAAEADTMDRLAKLKINSFGTAIAGWPKGPRYESYTNLADPVPRVIMAAQLNHMKETFDDGSVLSSIVFEEPRLNPIAAHSMDDVYIPRMKAMRPPANCLCR